MINPLKEKLTKLMEEESTIIKHKANPSMSIYLEILKDWQMEKLGLTCLQVAEGNF